MRRTIRAVASSLALAAALSSCGGDPEPQFEAEPSGEPSTSSPSPSAEPDAGPADNSPEAAIAFVEYWLEEFNEAVASGQTQSLAGLSTKDCSSCNALIDLIDETYLAGGSIEGTDWRLRELAYSTPDEGKTVGVGGTMLIPKQTIKRPGEKAETSSPIQAQYFFTLERKNDRWVVTAIATQS